MEAKEAKQIGLVIRQARTAKGLTQAELAKMVGISQATLSGIERGAHFASVPVMIRLFRTLDIGEKLVEVIRPLRPDGREETARGRPWPKEVLRWVARSIVAQSSGSG